MDNVETNDTQNGQPGCIYNPRGVQCDTYSKCHKCGWNPAVEKDRKEAIREARAYIR